MTSKSNAASRRRQPAKAAIQQGLEALVVNATQHDFSMVRTWREGRAKSRGSRDFTTSAMLLSSRLGSQKCEPPSRLGGQGRDCKKGTSTREKSARSRRVRTLWKTPTIVHINVEPFRRRLGQVDRRQCAGSSGSRTDSVTPEKILVGHCHPDHCQSCPWLGEAATRTTRMPQK